MILRSKNWIYIKKLDFLWKIGFTFEKLILPLIEFASESWFSLEKLNMRSKCRFYVRKIKFAYEKLNSLLRNLICCWKIGFTFERLNLLETCNMRYECSTRDEESRAVAIIFFKKKQWNDAGYGQRKERERRKTAMTKYVPWQEDSMYGETSIFSILCNLVVFV